MAKTKMRKAASRTARTGGQLGIGAVVIALLEAFTNFSKPQMAAIGMAVTLVATFVQNWLESRGTIPHLLEEPVAPVAAEATKPEAGGVN